MDVGKIILAGLFVLFLNVSCSYMLQPTPREVSNEPRTPLQELATQCQAIYVDTGYRPEEGCYEWARKYLAK